MPACYTRTRLEPMPLRNTAEAYGSLAKFLHWSIVVLIVSQWFLV